MTSNLGIYVVFALGVLLGGLLFNKDFRYKFFKGFRKFLGQISRGARNYSQKYEGESLVIIPNTYETNSRSERNLKYSTSTRKFIRKLSALSVKAVVESMRK